MELCPSVSTNRIRLTAIYSSHDRSLAGLKTPRHQQRQHAASTLYIETCIINESTLLLEPELRFDKPTGKTQPAAPLFECSIARYRDDLPIKTHSVPIASLEAIEWWQRRLSPFQYPPFSVSRRVSNPRIGRLYAFQYPHPPPL